MDMVRIKELFDNKTKASPATADQGKRLLSLELSEIKEVSDILFEKIEKKIALLEAVEAAADRKIAELERLIQRAEALKSPGTGNTIRHHEISSLSARGMKSSEIADVLGVPIGEVELILNLRGLGAGRQVKIKN